MSILLVKASQDLNRWSKFLEAATIQYNCNKHSTITLAPFVAYYVYLNETLGNVRGAFPPFFNTNSTLYLFSTILTFLAPLYSLHINSIERSLNFRLFVILSASSAAFHSFVEAPAHTTNII